MLNIYRPSEQEIMAEARSALQRRLGQGGGAREPMDRIAQLRDQIGPAPIDFDMPAYGTPGYALAQALGWIGEEQAAADRAAHEARRLRSLQTCDRHGLYERPRFDPPRDSGAYVPELSARLENDRNLTDGARRCARKIAELTYRRSREERSLDVKVFYLMKALGRSRRTVQRYLRLLEREGYVRVKVIKSKFARMCVGLVVELLSPLLARHHRDSWPAQKSPRTSRNPGASKESENRASSFSLSYYKAEGFLIPVESWAMRCRDGVFRSHMKTIQPPPTAS